MVAEKNFNAPSHADLPQIRNLEVIKAMQSLTSQGYVKTRFSWQWYYYTLTPEGLDYLREYLHLPSEIVPQTHKKPARPAAPAGGRAPRADGAYRAPRGGDREGYRRRDDGEGKEGASGDYKPVSHSLPPTPLSPANASAAIRRCRPRCSSFLNGSCPRD
jgi:small subunit ribosomal protein S10e